MAIEKMKFLSIVGARGEEHKILEELVLCEKVHVGQGDDKHSNNFIVHEYESMLSSNDVSVDTNSIVSIEECQKVLSEVEAISKGLDLGLTILKEDIGRFSAERAFASLDAIKKRIGPNLDKINSLKQDIAKLEEVRGYLNCITKNINFDELSSLKHIRYEIGTMSRDNSLQVRRNYENLSEVLFRIGDIEASNEDMYIVFYLTNFEEDTKNLLKSLSWKQLNLDSVRGSNIKGCKDEVIKKLSILKKQVKVLEADVYENKSEMVNTLSRIYSRMKLETKIAELMDSIVWGNNVFIINVWIRARDYNNLENSLSTVTDKFIMLAKSPEEMDNSVQPPTQLKNNWFTRPFEMIVGLYGMPSYNEIDPTPFLALTFCLMFGIMFGDVGQGFVYFLAGFLIAGKMGMEGAGGILKRLGISSMIFGVVYGSVFGFEDIPVLKDIALVHGGPLNTVNIMPILIFGVVFGVLVLTVSFIFGIINAFRKHDIEKALFSKTGISGYVFFMGLVSAVVFILLGKTSLVYIAVLAMVAMLVIMFLKEPLTNLVKGGKAVIEGDKGSYYVESGFEGVETILSALSNFISFIRVGAFALNHAGLFLAFKVMATMVPNPILKIIIFLLGNILILVLEGLVVFIQGLRLQYYEMFSKYFEGDGVKYEPITIQ